MAERGETVEHAPCGDIDSRIADAVGRDRVERYGEAAGGDLSAEQVGKQRSKPLLLDEDMRQVLARLGDHYGATALAQIKEREATGCLSDDGLAYLACSADRWFEFADAVREKRALKYGGKTIVAFGQRVEDADRDAPSSAGSGLDTEGPTPLAVREDTGTDSPAPTDGPVQQVLQ